MTALDYSQLSTDEWVNKFSEGAKQTGTVHGLDKEALQQSLLSLSAKQTKAKVEEMQALGAELRRRKPIGAIARAF
jgi:hypothetical protein